VVGFFFRKWELPVAPFIIGVVLGPTAETSLRQTLMMFKGNVLLIFDRPIASCFLYLTFLFLTVKTLYPLFRRYQTDHKSKKGGY
jgi:putative tricarboxylic transport membrane protein